MSKLAAAVLLLACVGIYDPPRMLKVLGPAVQMLKPAIDGLLPSFTFTGRRHS